ncbi:MAG: efflux RND transporter permease subunit [Gammaproteobacteria bacterium]|nr:efflux RND transporter permease subunit [Gammaproteobacteria bacterium]
MSDEAAPDASASASGRLIAYFCRNPVAPSVLLALVFVGGIVALNMTTLETFPEFDPRVVRVEVAYPGANPAEVEEDVVRRIEESLVGTVGVSRTVSVSRAGLGVVEAEMEPFADDIDTLNLVRTAVERIEDFPPRNAEQPEVTKVEVNRNVLTISVSSPTLGPYQLRRAAELLRDGLLLLPSVAIVELVGTRDREIRVEVDEETLTRYRITIADLVELIRKTSVNVTGGELRTESGDIVMSTLAKGDFAEDFARIVVVSRDDGSLVRLGEMATVRDSLLEQETYATVDGVPTVFLHVRSSPDTSPQDASSEVQAYLASYTHPQAVELAVWDSETWAVEDRLSLILRNGIVGLTLVFLVLLLVFDLRTATWVTIGVPVIFIGSLVLFPAVGLTINVIALFAFFVLIGVVVDDSIIVGESVASFREAGYTGPDAAIAGTKDVIAPVTVGALGIVIAFAVLLPLDGLIGQLLWAIPMVAVVVLLLSLAEAAMVLPGHLARQGRTDVWPLSVAQRGVQGWVRRVMQTRIVPLISWSVRTPFWPPAVVAASVLFAVALLAYGLVPYEPEFSLVDDEDVQVDLVLPASARFEDVEAAAGAAARAAEEVDAAFDGSAINAKAVALGFHIPREYVGGTDPYPPRGNVASVQIRLNPLPLRTLPVQEFKHRWQRAVANIPGVESVVFPNRNRGLAGLSYALTHTDAGTVQAAATDFGEALSRLGGLANVNDSISTGKRRFEVRLNEAGHASGLTSASVALQLRHAFYGAEAQRVQRGRDELLVMVRYPQDRRTSYRDLRNELIRLPGGREQVPLYAIADFVETDTLAERLRIDGRSAAVVSADVDRDAAASDAAEVVTSTLLPRLVRDYPGLHIQPHDQSREAARALDILRYSIPIGLLAVYVLLASFLRSFVQPLLAMAGIPMAFVGAVVGHWMLGYVFSFTSILGLIAVSGIVVSDTTLLLHRFNRVMLDPEMPAVAGIAAATRQRARAVLLTSLTMALGLMPMLFNDSETIQFLIPLVVSITFGLTFSGIGLVFFLPAVTMLVELAKGRLRALRAPAEPAPLAGE